MEEIFEFDSTLPEGVCIYAIGDIHGRADLLKKIHQKIRMDSVGNNARRKIILYLGDYVDRGTQSKEVLDELIENPLRGFEHVYLMGNHEYAMMAFVNNPEEAEAWLQWGGDATLASYGIEMKDENDMLKTSAIMQGELTEALPEEHKEFLQKLELYYESGDYIFVHAGLRPGVPLQKQYIEDLLMIRDEFILSKEGFDKTIVFGHTIFKEPFIKADKVGLDTGAYHSSALTCGVFFENRMRLLST
jgi:serine/threonine protein phosphatase 1